MSKKVTLGGDRLGTGAKMQVELKNYERSTFNLDYLWRSTMAAGTLVPFLCEVALPADTFDIDLNTVVLTHPTIGPLFGTYKVQLDVFGCPIRLYQGQLHNNKLGIGMKMSEVKLPIMELYTKANNIPDAGTDVDNFQINPSNLLAYLGYRGIGIAQQGTPGTWVSREFNAIPVLAYWDIYKQYYSNKMEEIGMVVHQGAVGLVNTITNVEIDGNTLPQDVTGLKFVKVSYTGATPILSQWVFNTDQGQIPFTVAILNAVDDGSSIQGIWNTGLTGNVRVYDYQATDQISLNEPTPVSFPLANIDHARESILAHAVSSTPFLINDLREPYQWLTGQDGDGKYTYLNTQEGLGLKTYLSDIFNNWLNTEWIDGGDGVS